MYTLRLHTQAKTFSTAQLLSEQNDSSNLTRHNITAATTTNCISKHAGWTHSTHAPPVFIPYPTFAPFCCFSRGKDKKGGRCMDRAGWDGTPWEKIHSYREEGRWDNMDDLMGLRAMIDKEAKRQNRDWALFLLFLIDVHQLTCDKHMTNFCHAVFGIRD